MRTIWIKQEDVKFWGISGDAEKADFMVDSLTELANRLSEHRYRSMLDTTLNTGSFLFSGRQHRPLNN